MTSQQIMSELVSEPKHTTTDAASLNERRIEFGKDVIGPVVAGFLLKLYSSARTFETVAGSKVLFCARAGVRIRRLLETFIERRGLEPLESGEDFWVSRLMAAKGAWHEAPDEVRNFLDFEFQNRTHEEFVSAMLRVDPASQSKALKACRSLQSTGGIRGFLMSDDPAARMIRDHFDEQAELYRSYLSDLVGDAEHVTLVDTGWQGTTQRFIMEANPELDVWGLYFGRSGFSHTDRSIWDKVIGLCFETDTFDRDQPASSILFHHHLIESLFEPDAGSIEHLETDKAGHISAPGAQAILDDIYDRETDPFFTGVCACIDQLSPADTLASIERQAGKAQQTLAEFIMLPGPDDAELYLATDRSADVGRRLRVPVLLPAADRDDEDSCQRRIDDALWQPGQIALEYPAETARPLQRRKTGLGRGKFKDTPAKPAAKRRSKPAVAVITRTMDRPMFLRRALISVSEQSFKDYLHVIVNDGGDNDVIRKAIEDAPIDRSRVILVNNVENRGMEAASNFAIESSDSEYIVIHDDDDSWAPTFLEETVGKLESDEGQRYSGVITASQYISEEITPDGIKICGTDGFMTWVSRVDLMEMAIGNYFPPIAFLFRRSVYNEIGGFNEHYPVLGDWDFNLHVLSIGDIAMINKPLANYHHRDRGDPQLFGNSVIADRDKHAYYNTSVRNDFIRSAMKSGNPAMAQLVGLGATLAELRSNGRAANTHLHSIAVARKAAVRSSSGAAESSSADSHLEIAADLYWRALHSLHSRIRAGSVRAFAMSLKGIGRRAARTVLRRRASSHVLATTEIEGLAASVPPGSVMRPDFSEERYLKKNLDVAEAVENGSMPSGYHHFINHGLFEGREY